MSENKTPQEVHQAYRQAWEQLSPEGQQMLDQVPQNWDELSKEQQAQFQKMATSVNMIVGSST